MELTPGIVTSIATPFLGVRAMYRNQPYQALCRPVMCGVTTGLHWMPQLHDRIWIAYIESATPVALCGLANFAPPSQSVLLPNLPAVPSGETWILGPTGNVLRTITNGSVQGGNPASTFKAVALNGDTIVGTITAPSGGGACSFSLTVLASSTALEGN